MANMCGNTGYAIFTDLITEYFESNLLDLDLGKISKTATKDPKSAPTINAFEFANGPLNDELMMTARLGERVPRIDIAANSRALS
jgi:hypothetical protein